MRNAKCGVSNLSVRIIHNQPKQTNLGILKEETKFTLITQEDKRNPWSYTSHIQDEILLRNYSEIFCERVYVRP